MQARSRFPSVPSKSLVVPIVRWATSAQSQDSLSATKAPTASSTVSGHRVPPCDFDTTSLSTQFEGAVQHWRAPEIEQWVYNWSSERIGIVSLNRDVFLQPLRQDIVHQVVLWQRAKRQQGFTIQCVICRFSILMSVTGAQALIKQRTRHKFAGLDASLTPKNTLDERGKE
jgi:hypothetical protein